MKNEKPAIIKEISLNEYILVFKYFMKQTKVPHAAGFVNAPLLYAKPQNAEIEQLVQSALAHGVLVQKDAVTGINEVIVTFMNAWVNSPQVVAIKKCSYSDQKGLYFARVEGMYLAALQDVTRDRITLAADPDAGVLYEYFKYEIEKKDVGGQFKAKNANKIFADSNRDFSLQVDPINRLFLQCLDNATGKNCQHDTLIHVGKKQLEAISLDENQRVNAVASSECSQLKTVILEYIDKYCEIKPIDDGEDDEGPKAAKVEDPEYYTRLSFMKLTKSEKFPKGFPGFLKMMFVNFFKGLLNWKRALKRIGLCVLLAVMTLIWNLYALCYLNDTFNINSRSIFGKATAYLLAGVATTKDVIGVPKIFRTFKTVSITAMLYFLLAIAIRSIVADVASGKFKQNLSRIRSFPKALKSYSATVPRKTSYYIWAGLAVSCVLNMVVFNPFTVFLLALMLLLSCMKCEDGGIAPFLMIFHSSTRYKKVMSGTAKLPLFGEYQLRLFGISVGLILCSILNAVLWFTMDFNFWVRLAISVVIIVLTLMKLGIIKISKPAATAIFVMTLVVATSMLSLADDGGWSESGGTLAGLMQNYGWQTVLGFSLTLAAAVAVGCVTFGLGTPVVLGAAAATFGVSALGATFTETGRKAAYDFVWGNYSPYGGDSKLAAFLNIGVSLVPGFGDAFGVVTGIRDCTYDVQHGDWGALALDGFGLALDAHGLIGDVGDVLKHTDDIAGAVVRNAEEAAGAVVKNADEVAGAVVRNADEAAGAVVRNADEAAGAVVRNADEAAGAVAKNADEAAGAAVRKTTSLVDEDALAASKSNISDLRITDPIKANEASDEAIRQLGKQTECSDEVIDSYIKKLNGDTDWDFTKKAKEYWGEKDWDSLTEADQKWIKEELYSEDVVATALSKDKDGALDTLAELRRRYDDGLFDSDNYSFDDIMRFKVNKNAGEKLYEGIEHSDLLPRVDEFISDDTVVQYVKNLCPDNEAIMKCTNLQEIADELYKNPVDLELVTFQNAAVNGSNIVTFYGAFGDGRKVIGDGGGVFCVPIKELQGYAENYPSLCKLDGDTFQILNMEEFGDQVLSGVPLSSVDGAYMITTKVPLNGSNISMPSVNNPGAYTNQFVSGGKLLSGEIEVTQRTMADIISDSVSGPGNTLIGRNGDIEYVINILR